MVASLVVRDTDVDVEQLRSKTKRSDLKWVVLSCVGQQAA
jgi:hypothetical protein